MMNLEKFVNDNVSSGSPIAAILSRYLPYWPLFLVLMILSVIGALVFLRYATPIYESSAKLLIKDEKKGLDESSIMESLDFFGSSKIVENEIEVIKSVELMSQVVNNLNLYAPITYEGKIRNASGYSYSPVMIQALHPDSIVEVKKVYFAYDSATSQVKMDSLNIPLNTWTKTAYGTLKFIPNRYYKAPPEPKPLFFSLVNPYHVTQQLLEDIEVEAASKQATIIYLRLKDPVTKRSENIIDELIAVYNKASIDDKNVLAANTLSFVNDRLNFIVSELDSVEMELQQYKNENKIVNISEQGKIFLESAEKTDEEATKSTIQLAVLDEVQNYVSGSKDKSLIIPSTLGVTDPVLSELLSRYYTVEANYQGLRKTTAENNPVLLSLAEEMNVLRPKILQAIQVQRKSLQVGTTGMTEERNRYAAMLNTIPKKERELLQISRQQSIKNSIYTFLLQKREETALSLAATASDSRLIDRAHSTIKPVSPKSKLTIVIAVAIGIFAGIFFVSMKEVLNPNVMFRSEIEGATSIPIIGEIANEPSKNPVIVADGKRTLIAEQFRQLRTSLSYIGINAENKRILVTSTVSGEGKSFISLNLALTLAFAGKKVLLMELDLRKPKLSTYLGINSSKGITNYFIGDRDARKIIRQTSINENLFIIPSGPIPPNPSELIMNGNMEELFSFLEGIFDYIVIDTAPVSPVTDAYILSPYCDATLYVIRHGVTPKTALAKIDKSNKLGGLKNMAIVFNGVKSRGIGKYGSNYGYGYTNADDYTSGEPDLPKSKPDQFKIRSKS